MEFEWDPEKAKSNIDKHGIDFEDAVRVFFDPKAIEEIDDAENYGEDRYRIIGQVDGRILFVVFTERDEVVRLISARSATPKERKAYEKAQDNY